MKALAPCHLRALVLTKFWPIFSYGVLNVYLVILLIHYSINCDPSVPRWNWAAINCPVSRRLGLAECHLVFCPFVGGCTTWHWPVQWCCPMDEAHCFFIIERGRSTAAATPELWAKGSRSRVLWYPWLPGLQNLLDSCFNGSLNPFVHCVFHLLYSPQTLCLLFCSTPRAASVSVRFFLEC
jgi:hypothetical protein